MKKINITFLLIIFSLSGCIKNTLDRKPLNYISDDDVWASADLIDTYMTALYDGIPNGFLGQNYQSVFTDEAATVLQGSAVVQSNYGSINRFLNPTMYTWIRRANYFVKRVQTAKVTPELMKLYTAECRFIRAYYYFDLVKKYGGVPIIEEVQTFTGDNLDQLQVPRNKEEEVYDFILNELDAAIADLPESRTATNANRATKVVAQALKSRAMLYGGSISKYGTIQRNGLVGVTPAKGAVYFAESLKASKAVMESNIYSLYNKSYNYITKTGDPVKNYTDIFLDENNKEVIFQKAYSFPDKTHSYDQENAPVAFIGSYGSAICPLLEMVESYEYKDGTPGILNVTGEFNSPDDLFANKDPRFAASIFRSNSPYIGRSLEIYSGIYDTDGRLYKTWNTPFAKDPSRLQVGLDGPTALTRYTKTGFYVRKYLNQSKVVTSANYSDQNYIDIRYAEILLNYTEAALETTVDLPGALEAINLVRARAGIRILTSAELTIDRLRNERKVELAFEDNRFWDIRRWRIGTTLFNNTFMHGLYPYLKYTGSGYKYIFTKVSGNPIDEGKSRLFLERDNYSSLASYILTNPNIVNNPGW